MHVVEGISDRVDRPRPRHQDRRGHVRARRDLTRVVEAYLGTAGWREVSASEAPLLQLEGINTYYGQIHILQDLDSRSGAGGARVPARRQRIGKSTTLKTILGIVRRAPARSSSERRGRDDDRSTAHRIKRGLAIVPENRRLFAPMTVLENLEMGAYLREGDLKEEYERVYTLFPLALRAARPARRARSRAASSRWSRWGAR